MLARTNVRDTAFFLKGRIKIVKGVIVCFPVKLCAYLYFCSSISLEKFPETFSVLIYKRAQELPVLQFRSFILIRVKPVDNPLISLLVEHSAHFSEIGPVVIV